MNKTQEALKLALEFIEANTYGGDDVVQLMAAIREALTEQPEQEPVAWETFALKFANGKQLSYEKPKDLPEYLDCRPLYTSPQPAQQQEPVGTVKELFTQAAWERLDLRGSTEVYTSPPASKPWVGLTQREKDLLLGASIHTQDAIDRTDAFLREKNQ